MLFLRKPFILRNHIYVIHGGYMVAFKDETKEEYVKVSIQREMINEAKRIIEADKRLGFVPIQEFVKEAVRSIIVKYGELYNEKKNKYYQIKYL